MLICDRMGISWMELMSDELPYEVVDNYCIVANEEAIALRRMTDEAKK